MSGRTRMTAQAPHVSAKTASLSTQIPDGTTTSDTGARPCLTSLTARTTLRSRGAMRKRAAVSVAGLILAVSVAGGCAAPPAKPIALHYVLAERENVSTRFSGTTIAIVPFADGRTDPYLYRRELVLAEGQDAGVWVANALKLELEHNGATVEALPAGTPPANGTHLTGQVGLLKAEATGWGLGGVLAALIGTGYAPHVTISMQVYEEGVPILSRQYDLQQNVPSDPGFVLMFARPPAERDVPPAFGVVLKKLIREKMLPDLETAIREPAAESPASARRD